MSNKNKNEVTNKLIKKIVFRVNTLFVKSKSAGAFEKKISIFFKDVLPELESLSWISLDDFGDLTSETIDVIFDNYREELKTVWKNSDLVIEYHETLGDLYIKKYREFEYSNNESMLKLMRYFIKEHDNSFKKVSDEKGGCYIATMVYEDYNHPQVLKLRDFRDNVLLKYNWGKMFVDLYYKNSPWFVEKLNGLRAVNWFIRLFLNGLIKLI